MTDTRNAGAGNRISIAGNWMKITPTDEYLSQFTVSDDGDVVKIGIGHGRHFTSVVVSCDLDVEACDALIEWLQMWRKKVTHD